MIAIVLTILQIPAIRLKYGHSVNQVAISYIKSTPFPFSIRKMEKNVKLREVREVETKLRHLLRQRNITIKQAAKELGIKRETLQRKLSGQYPFYLREAVVLHRLYFLDLDFLEIFSEYGKEQGVRVPCSAGEVI